MGDPVAIDLGKKVVKSFRGDKPTATPAPKPGPAKVQRDDIVKERRKRRSLVTSRPFGQAQTKQVTLGA